MPILKPISGHTSCAGVYRYLTKNGRALARDFLNIDAPREKGFDWVSLWEKNATDSGNKKASRRRLLHLVAGAGFEPTTFGL